MASFFRDYILDTAGVLCRCLSLGVKSVYRDSIWIYFEKAGVLHLLPLVHHSDKMINADMVEAGHNRHFPKVDCMNVHMSCHS
jgi:hypothetical protein